MQIGMTIKYANKCNEYIATINGVLSHIMYYTPLLVYNSYILRYMFCSNNTYYKMY